MWKILAVAALALIGFFSFCYTVADTMKGLQDPPLDHRIEQQIIDRLEDEYGLVPIKGARPSFERVAQNLR